MKNLYEIRSDEINEELTNVLIAISVISRNLAEKIRREETNAEAFWFGRKHHQGKVHG